MKKTQKIAVLMGGPSAEREISFLTGNAIVEALTDKGYNVVGLDIIPEKIMEQLRASGVTVVFNAVHGLFGEDGRLQGVLDMMQMPYTGSGVLASAVAMDKAATKRIFHAMSIPTPKYLILTDKEQYNALNIISEFQLPLVVKPASQGSSLGVVIVEVAEELPRALDTAFSFGKEVVIEEFIKGKELTVAILEVDGKITAFPVINIVPHSGVYDYNSKYTKGETEYLVPAPLAQELTEKVQRTAVEAYKAIGCSGIARADVMLDEEGNVFILELNTVPGMTATSLVPKAAAAIGISFGDLCEKILLAVKK